jgi:hypothetical protein
MIEIKGIKLKNSWNEITLKEYNEIKYILGSENHDEFTKELKVLALLAGSNDETMFDTWLRSEAHQLFQAQEFIYEEPVAEIQPYYTVEGIKYKLITEFDALECWQFIDLSNILKDPKHSDQRLHELCTLFLRKIAPLTVKQARNNLFIDRIKGSKQGQNLIESWELKYEEAELVPFSGELSKETAENLYNNLSFADAHAISFFLSLLSIELSKTALQFLETDQKEKYQSALKMLKEESTNNPKLKEITDRLDSLRPSVGKI